MLRRFALTPPFRLVWILYTAALIAANTSETMAANSSKTASDINTFISTTMIMDNVPLGIWTDSRCLLNLKCDYTCINVLAHETSESESLLKAEDALKQNALLSENHDILVAETGSDMSGSLQLVRANHPKPGVTNCVDLCADPLEIMASAYSQEQLQQFFAHISLPQALRDEPQASLRLLKALHVHTLSTLPYENLSLHYNAAHQIDLDPQHLFRKMVADKRGRGGFCMEIAILYNHILRAVGFDAYTAGVRTRGRLEGVPQGDYPGWNHIVNIVTFPDGTKYHSDVAFGGDGATMPMSLVDGLVHENLGTQQIRLVRDWIHHQVHRTEETKLWIYQYRNGADKEWNSFYSFPGIEFYALDWGVVNWWINTHPDSHQRRNVLVIKFLRRPVKREASHDGEQEIYGKTMLVNGLVKQNLGGKTETISRCKIEQDRLGALEKYFDIFLTEEEERGIYGYVSELHDTA
ncbi:hypothetical protein FZEAL_1128 [Fusarium zealandicum]|uniref:Arylamine N-acetyltransferase n=1 Tax=Fusarium zealandicum TaxID=1053134 RepID=A0A8H4UTQ8_9HYPO|nr:hypothetical protein FZEAL_1128 [Fusarium zealandicum]